MRAIARLSNSYNIAGRGFGRSPASDAREDCTVTIQARMATALGVALIALQPTPALAQAHDIQLAKQSYEAGKASGIRPQTRGENRMCGAHWDAFDALIKAGTITEADLEVLGIDFVEAVVLINKLHVKLEAGEGNELSNGYKNALNSAFEKAEGFIYGDVDDTKSLFENLGVCQTS